MQTYRLLLTACGILLSATSLCAQGKHPDAPWRGAGPVPCEGSDGGVVNCPPPPHAMAVRAGRMFDSNTGKMLTNQVILLFGERVTAVGPESQVKIPAGVEVIDLQDPACIQMMRDFIQAHPKLWHEDIGK